MPDKPDAVTYQNPVWPGYFADPFALKAADGNYYAYGTGPVGADGRPFPILKSTNLVQWESLGGALEPLASDVPMNYWAPEVAEKNGRYYLLLFRLTDHVRRAPPDPRRRRRPPGRLVPRRQPRVDLATRLHDRRQPLPRPQDRTVVPVLRDRLRGRRAVRHGAVGRRPLRRHDEHQHRAHARREPASADWQIYERNRNYKGKVWEAWHCIEGPSVVYHDGKYYCLYSAGAWYGESYGVGYAVADNPLGPWRDEFARNGPTVIKGIPGQVVGPGHNSTVIGPDGKTLFIVYHAVRPGAHGAAALHRPDPVDPGRPEGRRPEHDATATRFQQ